MRIIIPSPGGFFDISRTRNEFDIDKGFYYSFIIRYKIRKQLEKTKFCKQNLDWKIDECKLKKVILKNYLKLFTYTAFTGN